MERDNYKTTIIFKKTHDGEIIAFMPYEPAAYGNMLSYVHMGQHSEASIGFYHECKPAIQDEYDELKNELENHCGYNVETKKRINYDRYTQCRY
jgi:hypothetical protein